MSEITIVKIFLKSKIKFYYFQRHCLAINPLQKLCQNSKSLNRLIVNLFPSDNGYSLMLKTSSMQYAETVQLPYDECELLQYIDNEQVPNILHNFFGILYRHIICSSLLINVLMVKLLRFACSRKGILRKVGAGAVPRTGLSITLNFCESCF